MTVSLFASLLAIFLSAAYYITRLGFNNNILPVAYTLGISLFLINGHRLLNKHQSFYFSLICLIGIIFTSQINRLVTSQIPLLIIVVLGYGSFLINNFARPRITYIICALIFSLWVVGTIWGSNYHNPLLIENMVLRHGNEDTLFNPALAQMIKTYGIPSTGLDSVPYMSYHWGSHWLFAQFSNLTNLSLLTFYQLAYPVIFIPLFFHYFFLFVIELRHVFKLPPAPDLKFYIALILLFVGFIPNAILKSAGFPLFDLFLSESYLLSAIFFFMAITFIMKARNNFSFVHLVFAGLLVFAIGMTKISSLFLLFLLAAYFFWRLKLYQKQKYVFSAVPLLLIMLFTYLATYNHTYSTSYFSFLNYWQLFVDYPWRPFFLLFVLIWPILFIFAKLSMQKVVTVDNLKKTFVNKQILDVEAVAIFTFFGLIPPTFIYLDGAAAFYFFDLTRWFAAVFILANLPLFFPQRDFFPIKLGKIKLSHVFIFILITPFVISSIFNIIDTVSNFKTQQTAIRFNLINLADKNYYLKYIAATNRGDNFLERKLRTATTILTLPKTSMENNQYYLMLQLLETMGQKPLAEKKKTLIYIPYGNKSYWNLLSCLQTPLVAPAISGIAMLNGYPPRQCQVWAFGYEYYQSRESSVEKIFPNKQAMCSKTRQLGFSQVIIIPTNQLHDVKEINCQ